jgi:adenylyltransferase/sulfurtransferase
MLTDDDRERYLRHILLKEIGAQGQLKLKRARILVVGAGGLGSPILFYLAAAGVGALGLADDDVVSLSNLQRQILYADEDVGAAKSERAAEALKRLNPEITVAPYRLRVTAENAPEILPAYDVIIEGVDSFEARYALNRACIALRRPLISAAVGRFEGRLSLFKPWAGADLPCYRCFMPEPPPRDATVNCLEEGVLGPVAGVIGAMAALEAIKETTGAGDTLAGRLAIFDGLAAAMRIVALPRDPACPDCGSIQRG